VYAKGGTPIDPYRTTNGIGPTAPPYPGAAPSDADPTYPRGTIEQRSMVEDTASQISQEWKRGEDVVGPDPRVAYRLWSGLLSGSSATSGRLQMETQPDIWVVKLMPQSSLMLVTIDLGNGDTPIVPCTGVGHRLVLPAYRRWITLTNDSGLVTNVYYVVVGMWGDAIGKFEWL
jgi:hypothetical protein